MSDLTTYKLTYVNARGRAELIRLIFAQAKQKYEDYRTAIEEVLEEKKKSPYGILPTLTVGCEPCDIVLSGNATIARYLAEKYGLAGSNDLENAEVFGIIDATEYIWEQISQYFYERDPERKKITGQNLKENVLPFGLGKLERRAASNPEGWMYGNKVTYADFAIFVLADILNDSVPGVMDNFPSLSKVTEKVKAMPNIAEWLSKRPQTTH